MTLAELAINESAYVETINLGRFGEGLTSRLKAMGFMPNQEIKVIRKLPLNGPLQVLVGATTMIAIRWTEAALVSVRRKEIA